MGSYKSRSISSVHYQIFGKLQQQVSATSTLLSVSNLFSFCLSPAPPYFPFFCNFYDFTREWRFRKVIICFQHLKKCFIYYFTHSNAFLHTSISHKPITLNDLMQIRITFPALFFFFLNNSFSYKLHINL